MFKYVKYTPMTDPNTTHIFNEKDDKCRVHRFDVPYVSVECEEESDFAELMSAQRPDIEATEVTNVEFYDIVQHSDQIKRMYNIANEQYSKELQHISHKYSLEERDTWASQVSEANAVKADIAVSTPYLTALANDESITLDQAADRILLNKANYDAYSSECLERKWATLAKLKAEIGV